MGAWGELLLRIITLLQGAISIFKKVKAQEEQEALEKNPGHSLHDEFSSSRLLPGDDDENEAAKAELKKRLRSD